MSKYDDDRLPVLMMVYLFTGFTMQLRLNWASAETLKTMLITNNPEVKSMRVYSLKARESTASPGLMVADQVLWSLNYTQLKELRVKAKATDGQ